MPLLKLYSFLLILLNYQCSSLFEDDKSFQVKRYLNDQQISSSPPFKPTNLFINEDDICFFSYCWNHKGRCIGSGKCCQCQCENGKTFVSRLVGCKDATSLVTYTRKQGTACEFVTKKLRFSYVPLFTDTKTYENIELTLSYDHDFSLRNQNTTCTAGEIYVYDYHGHRVLYEHNKCQEILVMRSYQGKHFITWQSSNIQHWKHLDGQLVSVQINCESNTQTLSSCFLFQIQGSYEQDGDMHPVPLPPSPEQCPVTTPWIPPTPPTTITPSKTLITTPSGSGDKGNTVGIVAGTITAIIIVIAAIVILCVIRMKRKQRLELNRSDSANRNILQESMRRPPVKPNVYDGHSDYSVPNHNEVERTEEYADVDEFKKEDCQYTKIDNDDDDDDFTYTPVDDPDESHYECPDKYKDEIKWKRLSGDMSKRPLPERPLPEPSQESENPYYCGTAEIFIPPLPTEHESLTANHIDTGHYESMNNVNT